MSGIRGWTIIYLRGGGGGGLGKYQKKIRAQKKSRKKNIVHNKPIEKELGVIFKIIMPPVGELFDEFSGKMFLGHLKKISCKGMLQKKNSCKQLGDEKFVHRKIPPPQISNGPSLKPCLNFPLKFYMSLPRLR